MNIFVFVSIDDNTFWFNFNKYSFIIFNDNITNILNLFLMLYNHCLHIVNKDEFIKQIEPLNVDDIPLLINVFKSIIFVQLNSHDNSKYKIDNNFLIKNIRIFIHLIQDKNIQYKFIKNNQCWLLNKTELNIFKNDYYNENETKEDISNRIGTKVLNIIPFSVPFHERLAILKSSLDKEKSVYKHQPPKKLIIRRDFIVADGFAAVVCIHTTFVFAKQI